MYRGFFKRFLDLLVSVTAFIVLSPVFLVVTLLLLWANDGKPFFFQARPGKNGHIFRVIKFKTMNDKRDADGLLLPDAQRLTWIGKIIRKTSLDELPQLINVIKGDMSLVGPRPLLPEYLPLYNDHHKRRHEVRPGITGLAQVEGRNHMKFSQRFNLDVYYVDNCSFALDVKIILKTFLKVFKTSDIVHGQTVDDIDDIGITKNLSANHFKAKA